MVLDGALADAEIGGDILAGVAGEDHVHDLALSRGQTRDVSRRRSLARRSACSHPATCSSARSTQASSSSRPIGFSMKSEAPAFMASTAIGTSPLPVIMMAGSRWPAVLEPLQQFEPVHPGQVGVDQEAALAARAIGVEEGLAVCIILDDPAIVLEHGANRLADVAVVVDDEDDGRLRLRLFGWCAARGRRSTDGDVARRRWIDCVSSAEFHGLVELHAVLRWRSRARCPSIYRRSE